MGGLEPANIAAIAGIGALVLVIVFSVRAQRQYTRTRDTYDAAMALADVHLDTLGAFNEQTARRIDQCASNMEQLSESVTTAREGVEVLMYLADKPFSERERFYDALLDVVLPVEKRRATD
jgi:hypothetical protein